MDTLPDQSWKKEQNFYIRALASEECYCDREKKHGYAFCYSCYKSLPPEMQRPCIGWLARVLKRHMRQRLSG